MFSDATARSSNMTILPFLAPCLRGLSAVPHSSFLSFAGASSSSRMLCKMGKVKNVSFAGELASCQTKGRCRRPCLWPCSGEWGCSCRGCQWGTASLCLSSWVSEWFCAALFSFPKENRLSLLGECTVFTSECFPYKIKTKAK